MYVRGEFKDHTVSYFAKKSEFYNFDKFLYESLKENAASKFSDRYDDSVIVSHLLIVKINSALTSLGGVVRVYYTATLKEASTNKDVWMLTDSVAGGGLILSAFDKQKGDVAAKYIIERLVKDGLIS